MRVLRHIEFHFPQLLSNVGAFVEGSQVHITRNGRVLHTMDKPTTRDLIEKLREGVRRRNNWGG